MHWTRWPYWVRGGAIGLGIILVSSGLTESCSYLMSLFVGHGSSGFECLPFAIAWSPFWFSSKLTSLPSALYDTVGILVWFVSGSLGGWIIGTLRNRGNNK